MDSIAEKLDKMRADVETAHALIRKDETVRKQTRLIQGLFLVAIILVAAVSFWRIYVTTRQRFEQGQMTEAMRRELQALVPQLQDAATDVMQDALPAYQDAFTKKFQEARPKFEKKLQGEVKVYTEYVRRNIQPRLVKGFDRIVEKQMAVLMKRTGVGKADAAKIFANVQEASQNQVTTLIAEKVLQKQITTLDEIGEVLGKFNVSDIRLSGEDLVANIKSTLLDLIAEQLKSQITEL